jgi:hypothetical protein
MTLGLGPVAGHLDPARLTTAAPALSEQLLALVFEEIHGG